LEKRIGFSLEPARAFSFDHSGDLFGWREGHDGRWHLTVHIESGRVADHEEARHLTGLREIARVHSGDFRLTANQNLIIAGVPAEKRDAIDGLVEMHRLDGFRSASPLRRGALACVALPTCGLAMAEAERYLPSFIERVEALLAKHGLGQEPISLRISGCPNGCSRPYVAEIALVGKAPGRYNLHLGGDARGQRLNWLHRENVDEAGLLESLDAVFAAYALERHPGESFGDYCVRTRGTTAASPSEAARGIG
jgi:sulfite reductase (NADPH) hemoprotein beta-component